ncbi:hypothetical protein Q31b_19030 [Novipirellula aureliae]|uniref:Heparinase II/III-like protein n=1 Tax=Novipirellula aureliae TaxID=2527966 RepID=A0A5C6E905_9BACT|nr:hypothetical protein [Novipirellula aureliae]TWU44367.1 hypothetical protein Q31b_19030 [Novipirellula aureliae]
MKHAFVITVPLLCLAIACSCSAQSTTTLDFSAYYELGPKGGDVMYPTAEQLEMLKAVMPKDAYQPAPPLTDRMFWDGIASTPLGKEYLKKANSELDKAPEVPITDEIYRRANKEGNRGIYKPRYYRTIERLENFILAECMENQGRFLEQIEVYIDAMMDMKSWLHPNHDGGNRVLDGKSMGIDLGSRRFGTDLALAEVLLGDKLPTRMRQEMSEKLRHRIIDCYLQGCSGEQRPSLGWFKSTSNWNSVCTSGSLFVAITSDNATERMAAIGCALNSMKAYLSGFAADGYCSEGTGYWDYGFGHYLYLAQMVYDYTEGRINLFKAHNPTQLQNVGTFPQRYEIQYGTAAPFADGSSRAGNHGGFANFMAAKYYGARKPTSKEEGKLFVSDEATYQLIAWSDPEAFTPSKDTGVTPELPNTTYFDSAGMVISRGKQKVPFSIAIKAGHNSENHNHSDVGTYSIVLDRDFMTGDIGAPSYIAGAFASDNPARSSWGHPVPRIDNILQSNGRDYAGKITDTDFTKTRDRVVMNIKDAYKIPHLTSLVRTMENDRSGTGTITVSDEFSSSRPVTFGTAIMTLGRAKYEIVDDKTVIITSKNQKIKAVVSSTDGELKIIGELVPVERLREGAPAHRIGVDFTEPVSEGVITVRYTPVF